MVQNFRIAVFCYAKRGSSAEETNRVQVAVLRFSLPFSLGLSFSYGYVQFYKTISPTTFIPSSLYPQKAGISKLFEKPDNLKLNKYMNDANLHAGDRILC